MNTRKRYPILAALLTALPALSSYVAAPTRVASPATPATAESMAAPQEAPTAEPTATPAVAELSAVPFDLGKALHENGKLVGQGRVEQTVPIQSSVDETLDLRRKNHGPWMRQETNALGRLSQ